MQDVPLVRALAEARSTLDLVFRLVPDVDFSILMEEGVMRGAVDSIDRARPLWTSHFGLRGPFFPLDRLVFAYLLHSLIIVYSI